MKKLLLLILAVFASYAAFGQVPDVEAGAGGRMRDEGGGMKIGE